MKKKHSWEHHMDTFRKKLTTREVTRTPYFYQPIKRIPFNSPYRILKGSWSWLGRVAYHINGPRASLTRGPPSWYFPKSFVLTWKRSAWYFLVLLFVLKGIKYYKQLRKGTASSACIWQSKRSYTVTTAPKNLWCRNMNFYILNLCLLDLK